MDEIIEIEYNPEEIHAMLDSWEAKRIANKKPPRKDRRLYTLKILNTAQLDLASHLAAVSFDRDVAREARPIELIA